jgi:hypothetical protein
MTYDTYSFKLYLKVSVQASDMDHAEWKLEGLLDNISEYFENSGMELEDIEVK